MTYAEANQRVRAQIGAWIDLDGAYGAQCFDFSNWWSLQLGYGRFTGAYAYQIYGQQPQNYTWVANSPTAVPPAGAVVVWSKALNGTGHTAVAVEGSNTSQLVSVDENWYNSSNKGSKAALVVHNYNNVVGWGVPKNLVASNAPSVGANQRVVSYDGCSYREEPKLNATIKNIFNKGDVLDFKGYVTNGTSVEGDSVWLVGAFTGGFISRTCFDNKSLDGIPNITPTPAPAPQANNERVVTDSVLNIRKAPSAGTTPIVGTLQPQQKVIVQSYTSGEVVAGNGVWFCIGKDQYVWSDGFSNNTTTGISNVEYTVNPVKPPVPVEPPTLVKDAQCVTNIEASPNYIAGNISPVVIIVHQWGAPTDGYTYLPIVKNFKDPVRGLAPHYVVDDTHITQMVAEANRAQHAGASGNGVAIGIEFDPNGGEKMYELGRKLIADIRARRGNLPLEPHSKYVATQCPKYINMAKLEPVVIVPSPNPAPDLNADNNALLKQILSIVQWIKDLLGKVFK